MPSSPTSSPQVDEKPIPIGHLPSTTMPAMNGADVNTSELNQSTAAEPHTPPAPLSDTSPTSGGWYETRQALQKDMLPEHDINGRKAIGGFSVRSGLTAYLVLTLIVLAYEGVYIILYFSGVISDGLEEAAAEATSPEERDFILDLESKQKGWLTAQLVWYSLGILFCFFGFVVLYLERLALFKIFQAWLIVHVFAYFVAATVFEQFAPAILQTPGYATLVIFIAALNIYAGYMSVHYKKRLIALEEQSKFYSSRPTIGEIAAPV